MPNIYFGEEKISGKSQEEALKIISASINSFENQSMKFNIQGESTDIRVTDLGLTFENERIVKEVFSIGRSGDIYVDFLAKIKAPFVNTIIKPVYTLDFSKLTKTLDRSFGKYNKDPISASVVFKNGNAEIAESKEGLVIDRTKLVFDLIKNLDNMSNEPISLSQVQSRPLVETEQAQKALEKVQVLNKQRVILSFDHDLWVLSGNKIFDLLTFKPYNFEGNYLTQFQFGQDPVAVKSINLPQYSKVPLEVSLDEGKLDVFIGEIADFLDKPTVDATLKFEDGRVMEFTPAQDGQKLDRTLTKNLILEKISIDNPSGDKDININLPVSVSKAKIANEEINSLGIKELLGRGISYFGGSIANRIHNLTLGSARTSGALVGPGEIFSFNKTVGEVSGATGYKPAYVISQGRTVLDDGGGMCQVSTTVFRAVLNSGLPVVSRTAHAYRVGYYEQGGFKPGLDATVWAPNVDFAFKNDTDKHILVQAQVDASAAKLQVDIYGTLDGRKVELSSPVISNQSPPPPDKYQDDGTLPKGVTKQVDFSAWGANVIFTRKVSKNGQGIIDETFRSNYRPWQAIFLVGTGA